MCISCFSKSLQVTVTAFYKVCANSLQNRLRWCEQDRSKVVLYVLVTVSRIKAFDYYSIPDTCNLFLLYIWPIAMNILLLRSALTSFPFRCSHIGNLPSACTHRTGFIILVGVIGQLCFGMAGVRCRYRARLYIPMTAAYWYSDSNGNWSPCRSVVHTPAGVACSGRLQGIMCPSHSLSADESAMLWPWVTHPLSVVSFRFKIPSSCLAAIAWRCWLVIVLLDVAPRYGIVDRSPLKLDEI